MKVTLGFAPLSDAASLVAADALGFFAEEGLEAELIREVSWATVRDKVALGALDGAHMLSPMPLAAALGGETPILAPLVMARGGASITLATRIAETVGDARGLAHLIFRRKAEDASRLTLAVVYPWSVHNYLLRTWLADAGVDPEADVRMTIAAPSRMAELLAGGVIEGFCAGEPWGPAAEAAGAGRIVVRPEPVTPGAPDKVLGVGRSWAEADAGRVAAVVRAVRRAADWCEARHNRGELASLLSERIGQPAEIIAPGLDPIDLAATPADHAEAVGLIGQMQRWGQVTAGADADALARAVFRGDLCA
jgi:NitT/TauT family transport system ATP-binding protein/nitrate/nitrite transport system substrate-binding protein